jgi:hypothetical protein
MRYLILLVLVTGCARTEYSVILSEDGEVYDTAYVPAGHGSDIGVIYDLDGNVTITPVSVSIPAKYAVVFRCQHGKFTVNGEELYQKLDRGQKVTIWYRQVVRVTKLDGKEVREVIDLDFLDAVPKDAERREL